MLFCFKNKINSLFFFFLFFLFGGFQIFINNVSVTEAVGCQASCNNGNGITCASRCFYTDSHAAPANGGSCSVGTNLASCNPLVTFDSNCSDANMSCQENNCAGLNAPTGTACTVVLGGWTGVACTTDVKNGTWDNTNKKCVECPSGKVWADSSQVYYLGNPVDATICSSPSTLILSGSATPTSIVKNTGTSTITFTVTDGTNPVSGAVVNAITATGGSTSAASCTTNAAGTCNVTYTAGGTAGNYMASSTKATKAGYTDSSGVSVNIRIINTLCVPNDCSGAVASSCDCNSDTAAAGQYCCDSSTSGTYAFGSQAACQTACGTCTATQMTEITGGGSGNCNFADAPCAKINGLTPGVSVRKQTTTSDLYLFDPNGSSQYWSAAMTFSGTRGDEADDCVPGTWTIKLGGTTCSASAVSGGACPVCNDGVDCNGNQKCSGGAWVACPGGETCLAGACVPVGPPPVCGDTICSGGETNATCPADCPAVPVCGDGSCNGGETNATCPADCPAAPSSDCNPNAWAFCNVIPSITTISQAAETLLGYLLGLIGSIALLLIIIAGVMYMTSAGSEDKISTSKRILSGAVIGLGVALLAYSLLQVIISILNAP